MERAAILVGVDKTGGLPRLNDAAAGAKRMMAWALSQGFDESKVKLFTDESGPVEIGPIKKWMLEVIDPGDVGQMIVYFAGHGLNLGRSEYWLLSDAPRDPDAAVNVAGSIDMAKCAGIPHVVFISDACRTAANTIQTTGIQGSHIFPNDVNGERSVDVFYACGLGSPALEVRDPADLAAGYKAVYTATMVDVLEGKQNAVIEEFVEGQELVGLVRPDPLGTFLKEEVPKRLAGIRTATGPAIQIPSHIANSKDTWLARFARRQRVVRAGAATTRRMPSVREAESLDSISNELLQHALRGESPAADDTLTAAAAPRVEGSAALGASLARLQEPFGPSRFETGCGFKVRGHTITDAFSATAGTAVVDTQRQLLRVDVASAPAASVLLVFADGTGVVLPAIAGFLASVTFEDGELVTVSYEPSENSARWADFQSRAPELRRLRSIIASTARLGTFRPRGEDPLQLARRMQFAKGIDPSMALYAGYAYRDLQRPDLLREMHGVLCGDLGFRLFDVALLTRELDDRAVDAERDVFPPLPVLAQGWALLSTYRVRLPASLSALHRHLLPSLWSTFDARGVELLRAAIAAKEVR